MVNPQSSFRHWILFYTALAILSLVSIIAVADKLQVNIERLSTAGSEVNVSNNATFMIRINTSDSTANITNLSLGIAFAPGFHSLLNSSVQPNSTGATLIAWTRLYNGTSEVNLTNGTSFNMTVTFRAERNVKDINFTVVVNSTQENGLGLSQNITNVTYNYTAVVFFSNYSTLSTNLSSFLFNVLNILNSDSNALGPYLANGNGSINWTHTVNFSNMNLDVNSYIGNGTVALNSSALDGSNAAANRGANYTAFIQMFNVSCPVRDLLIAEGDNITTNPSLYRSSGRDCKLTNECVNVTCADSVLAFTVLHFSAFIANGNANLTINNTALPPKGQVTGATINFTANYTNATNGEVLNGSCSIFLSQGFGDQIAANMSQGANSSGDSYFFNFTSNRTQVGLFSYNISCDTPYTSNLTTNLTYNVTDNVPPQVVNLTPNGNQTFNQSMIMNVTAYVLEDAGGYGIDDVFVNVTDPTGGVNQYRLSNTSVFYNVSIDSTPLPFGRYNITIQANDTAGNLNYSVNASFFVNDTTNPRVINMSPNGTNISVGALINISVNITDTDLSGNAGSGIATVLVNITLPESVEVITLTAQLSPTTNIYVINFSNTTQSGRYNWTVDVNDSYNNRNATQSAFFAQSSALTNSSSVNSTVANSTVYNTTTVNSNITNSNVNSSNVQNSTVNNASVQYSTVNRSTFANSSASNSSIDESNITRSNLINSTVRFSNVTASTFIATNATASRINRLVATRSNITHMNVVNSSIVDSSLIENADSSIDFNNIENSTLLNVIAADGTPAVFNNSRAENLTNMGLVTVVCNRFITPFQNVNLTASGATEILADCTPVINVTILATGNEFIDSTLNFTFLSTSSGRNATITNNYLLVSNSSIIQSTVNNSIVNGSVLRLGSSLESGNVTSSIVENSSVVKSNISSGSVVNLSKVDNSTIVFSNVTSSTLILANVTSSRANRLVATRSNITHMNVVNSSIVDSSLIENADSSIDFNNIENSTLLNVIAADGTPAVFNNSRAENLTNMGLVTVVCNRFITPFQNVNLTASGATEILADCTPVINVTILATGNEFIDSTLNFTLLSTSSGRNATISNNYLRISNSSIIQAFVNNSIINGSVVLSGTNIESSNITASIVENASIIKSNISALSVVNNSKVDNSTISAANVSNSTIINSNITGGGTATRSVNSSVRNSTVLNSSVYNATIIASTVRQAFVYQSFVDPSTIVNSTVTEGSNITDSQIQNSTIIGSNITNAIVNNSRVNGSNVINANVTDTSVLINVSRVENVTLSGVTLQNVGIVSDILSFIAFNTSAETTVNVSRNVTYRLVLNNSMPFNVTNLTVTALVNNKYVNYSLSSPQSRGNASVTSQFANAPTNFTQIVALGNAINAPLIPGAYIEINFTFIALANHTNLTTWFNVTAIRSDNAVRQFNTTLNITITAPQVTDAVLTTAGFQASENNLTTNLSLVPDISNVSGFRIANKNGSINWSFAGVSAVGPNGAALPIASNNILFGKGDIGNASRGAAFLIFNTSAFGVGFNRTSVVTFFNVSCGNRIIPVINTNISTAQNVNDIASGGRDCVGIGACTNFSCSAGSDNRGNLSFTALHFTSFASNGNANLTIAHDATLVGHLTTFNATYINSSNGILINSSTCNISVTDDPLTVTNMSPNLPNNAFTFSKTPTSGGSFIVNVTCSHPGFTTINAIDNVTFAPVPTVGGAIGGGGGGGGGYNRRISSDEGGAAPGAIKANAPVETPPPTPPAKAQTAFEILDLIKSFYKGVRDYTPFQIIDIIKRFYAGK